MHSVLSVSPLYETSHIFDDNKVIGHPGHDTMSSCGWLATKPQNLVHAIGSQIHCSRTVVERDLPRETLPIMLTTGT